MADIDVHDRISSPHGMDKKDSAYKRVSILFVYYMLKYINFVKC